MSEVHFFSDGFFGYSKEKDFFMGSFWHILPIVLMIIVIILIYKYRKQIREYKYETRIRYILSFIMLIVEMSYFWRLLYVGSEGKYDTMMGYLPIQMCQWGLIICVFTVISKNKKLFSINYFITLLFASIAIFDPLVIEKTGPGYYRYYQFWLEHILPIISIFYLMFVHNMKPEYSGIYKTFIVTLPLAALAIVANNMVPGARYLYLTLDIPLPKNQIIRVIILSILAIGIYHIMYLPFYKSKK